MIEDQVQSCEVNQKRARLVAVLSSRRLPWILALVAVVFMIPTLSSGLFGDDLIQRLNQLSPAELPTHAVETGFVADNSGTFRTVVHHLLRFDADEKAAGRARECG